MWLVRGHDGQAARPMLPALLPFRHQRARRLACIGYARERGKVVHSLNELGDHGALS